MMLATLTFYTFTFEDLACLSHLDCRTGNQITEVIPGNGALTPNVCYELMKVSQKQVPDGDVALERNPAYATMLSSAHVNP